MLSGLSNLLNGRKTYLAGLGLVGLGVFQIAVAHDLTGLQNVLTGLGTIFMRNAVSKMSQ